MAQQVKNLAANAGNTGDAGSIPGWGRSPGEGHGNPLQYSCLEEPMDREALGSAVKSLPANAGDLVSIPGPGRSPGEGNGSPLQYSCLEEPMDNGARGAATHGVA